VRNALALSTQGCQNNHCQWQSFSSRIQYTLEPVISRLTLLKKQGIQIAAVKTLPIQNTDNTPSLPPQKEKRRKGVPQSFLTRK
jgi:hypothetical protein